MNHLKLTLYIIAYNLTHYPIFRVGLGSDYQPKNKESIIMKKYEKTNKEILAKIEQGKRVPILRILRYKCLECCCWQSNEVRLCGIKDCILHKFRFGRNPVKKVMSEKQMANAKKLGQFSKRN